MTQDPEAEAVVEPAGIRFLDTPPANSWASAAALIPMNRNTVGFYLEPATSERSRLIHKTLVGNVDETGPIPVEDARALLSACRERWKIVKALIDASKR